jgi:hypothetical protein
MNDGRKLRWCAAGVAGRLEELHGSHAPTASPVQQDSTANTLSSLKERALAS